MKLIKQKALIIGLGGTGCAALSHLAEKLENSLKIHGISLANTPLRFLAFDLDTEPKSDTSLPYSIEDYFYELRADKVSRKIKYIDLEENKSYHEWYPDSDREYINDTTLKGGDGAGQFRSLGRMAYCEDQEIIEDNIDQALQELKAIEINGIDTRTVNVYIISSLAGGTGSGLLLDVAFHLQKDIILNDSNMLVNTYGMLLLPDVFDKVDHAKRTKANSYATLKELAGFYLQTEDFEMNYPKSGLFIAEKGKATPFRPLFLFNNQLHNRQLKGKKETIDYIANVIHIQLTSIFTRKARSATTNKKAFRRKADEKGSTAFENGFVFSEASGAIIEFPGIGYIERVFKEKLYNMLSEYASEKQEHHNCDLSQLKELLDTTNNNGYYVGVYNNAIGSDILSSVEKLKNQTKESVEQNFNKVAKELFNIIDNDNLYVPNERLNNEIEKHLDLLSINIENAINDIKENNKGELYKTNFCYLEILELLEQYLTMGNENSIPIKAETVSPTFKSHSDPISNRLKDIINLKKKSKRGWFYRLIPVHNNQINRFISRNLKVIQEDIEEIKNTNQDKVIKECIEYVHTVLRTRLQKDLAHFNSVNTATKKTIEALRELLVKQQTEEALVESDKNRDNTSGLNFYEVFQNSIDDKVNELVESASNELWTNIKNKIQTPPHKSFSVEELQKLIEENHKKITLDGIDIPVKEIDEKIKKVIKNAKIDVFTNRISHDNERANVYCSFPKHMLKFHAAKSVNKTIRAEIEKSIKSVFSSSYQTFDADDDNIVIYYESHYHPAANIKGITDYHAQYQEAPHPLSLFHIHKNYPYIFPDLISSKMLDLIVNCGNPECNGFNIKDIPRDVHMCPSCNKPILNRCGNLDCTEDNLVERLGGIEKALLAEICPTCHNTIKTYKWECTKQHHGLVYRNPIDPFCPECEKEAKSGKIEYEDRSCREDDITYPILCPTCIEQKVTHPFRIPRPEFYKGVPYLFQTLLRSILAKYKIKNNTCPKCNSKIYPECPHHDTEIEDIHFVDLTEDNRLECSMSDIVHSEEVDFYECFHCHYPIKFPDGKTETKCPRCHSLVIKCEHCSDDKHYAIDEKSLKKNKNMCPICKYEIIK